MPLFVRRVHKFTASRLDRTSFRLSWLKGQSCEHNLMFSDTAKTVDKVGQVKYVLVPLPLTRQKFCCLPLSLVFEVSVHFLS